MNVDKKFDLITRNLGEVVTEDALKKLLEEKKHPHIYLGNATTGKPHLAYFLLMQKLADFLEADCKVTVLFADLHGYLDNMKSSWDLLEKRTTFYKVLIQTLLKHLGVDLNRLNFVVGTDIQLSKEYTLDMYKLSAIASLNDTQRAGSEVVKQVESPKLSGLLYPMLQALDEQYLDVDMQFGGVDQRKIFMFAREFLPKLGYDKRTHLMVDMIGGLTESGKMSSSEPKSKIDFDDSDEVIKQKVMDAYSKDGEVENNGLLGLCKFVLFPYWKDNEFVFEINRPQKYGGNVTYKEYKALETDFAENNLSSIDLKQNLYPKIIDFIKPIRVELGKHKELINKAYPDDL